MTTKSPWMPDAADESTIVEVMREMLDLDIAVTRRNDGGLRVSADSVDATDPRTTDASLIQTAV